MVLELQMPLVENTKATGYDVPLCMNDAGFSCGPTAQHTQHSQKPLPLWRFEYNQEMYRALGYVTGYKGAEHFCKVTTH